MDVPPHLQGLMVQLADDAVDDFIREHPEVSIRVASVASAALFAVRLFECIAGHREDVSPQSLQDAQLLAEAGLEHFMAKLEREQPPEIVAFVAELNATDSAPEERN